MPVAAAPAIVPPVTKNDDGSLALAEGILVTGAENDGEEGVPR